MTPSSLFHSSVAEVETFSKPGVADVTPGDVKKLSGILKHYAKEAHPFTACKRDQLKHGLSEDHANRRCAVIKTLIGRNSKNLVKEERDLAIDILAEALDTLQGCGAELGPPHLAEILSESVLTGKARDKLAKSDFAIPGKRAYPIHDPAHARNALARVAQHGTPEEQAQVRAAVKKRYPDIGKLKEAEELGALEELLRDCGELVEAAPRWMLPVAARRPGFRPTKPPTSSSSTYNAQKHPRAAKGTAGGGRFIRSGSSGSEVTAIQQRLNIARTGTYNSATKAAVRAFQRRAGIQVDGVVGRQTVAALRGTRSGVSPGALTRNDRRFLRRYAKR